MRIIAGSLGGRTFDTPKGHRTHPMSDKVRGGLFNALGDIEGLTFLDAFAGSGGLSLEAVSRGAKSVIAIDVDKQAHRTITENILKLDVADKIEAIRANASGWSDNNPDKKFNIVIAAPPYDDLQPQLVEKLTKHVSESGLYVLDWPGKLEPPSLDGFGILVAKKYGDAQIVFYRKA